MAPSFPLEKVKDSILACPVHWKLLVWKLISFLLKLVDWVSSSITSGDFYSGIGRITRRQSWPLLESVSVLFILFYLSFPCWIHLLLHQVSFLSLSTFDRVCHGCSHLLKLLFFIPFSVLCPAVGPDIYGDLLKHFGCSVHGLDRPEVTRDDFDLKTLLLLLAKKLEWCLALNFNWNMKS